MAGEPIPELRIFFHHIPDQNDWNSVGIFTSEERVVVDYSRQDVLEMLQNLIDDHFIFGAYVVRSFRGPRHERRRYQAMARAMVRDLLRASPLFCERCGRQYALPWPTCRRDDCRGTVVRGTP